MRHLFMKFQTTCKLIRSNKKLILPNLSLKLIQNDKPIHLLINLLLKAIYKYNFKITSKVCRLLHVSRIEPFDKVIEEPIPEVSKGHPFQLGVYG